MLEVDFLGAPAVRELIEYELDDFHLRTCQPGDALPVEFDLCGNRGHALLYAPSQTSRPYATPTPGTVRMERQFRDMATTGPSEFVKMQRGFGRSIHPEAR